MGKDTKRVYRGHQTLSSFREGSARQTRYISCVSLVVEKRKTMHTQQSCAYSNNHMHSCSIFMVASPIKYVNLMPQK